MLVIRMNTRKIRMAAAPLQDHKVLNCAYSSAQITRVPHTVLAH